MSTHSGRRYRRVGLAAGVLILLVAAGFGVRAWRRPRPTPPLGPKTTTIAPGVHMIRGLGPSVAYVIETSEGPVLIDSGLEDNAATLKSQMDDLLLDWRSIKAILITHVHGDHTGGAEAMRKAARAKIHVGKDDTPPVRAGGPREAFFSAFYMPNHTPHKTTVDVELSGGEDLVFGDTTIHAIGTPGHTPGSICYLLERDGKRLLFSGDVIMHLSDSKPLGTYSAYLAPKHRGDAKTYLESIKKLRDMKSPDLVLPGHPPLGPNPNVATMTPKRWKGIMDEGVSDMQTLIARHKADGEDFLDDIPKQLLPDLYYLGDFDSIATYAFIEQGKLVLVDAPGGADYAKTLADRLAKLGVSLPPSFVLLTAIDPPHTSGLRSVIDRWKTAVIVAPGGVETARALCPQGTTVDSTDDLGRVGLTGVKAIPLKAVKLAPVAYSVIRQGKTVLLSGSLPVKFDEEAWAKLPTAPKPSREDTVDALMSIQRLEELKPDLWLPSSPWHGQNANLYDDQWKEVITSNYRVRHLQLNEAARTKR